MTPDEARALFDAVHDGELDGERKRAFDEVLAQDPQLREDYLSYERVLKATGSLAREATHVDLLSGVQHKLRKRSGGRFYRDEFAAQRGRNPALTWVLLASTVLLIAVLVWLSLDAFGAQITP